MLVQKRSPWAKQPQVPRPIDWSNPLTVGLLASVNNADMLLKGVLPTSLGATPYLGGDGKCLAYSGGKTQYAFDKALADGCVTPAGCSVFVLFDVDTLTNYSGLISLQQNTTTYAAFEIRLGNGAGDSRISLLRGSSSSYSSGNTGADRLTAGQRGVAMLVVFPSDQLVSTATIYINGVAFSAAMSGSASTVAAPTSVGLCLGGRSPDTTTKLDGNIYVAHIWGRALSANEALAVTNNPWQIYAP